MTVKWGYCYTNHAFAVVFLFAVSFATSCVELLRVSCWQPFNRRLVNNYSCRPYMSSSMISMKQTDSPHWTELKPNSSFRNNWWQRDGVVASFNWLKHSSRYIFALAQTLGFCTGVAHLVWPLGSYFKDAAGLKFWLGLERSEREEIIQLHFNGLNCNYH